MEKLSGASGFAGKNQGIRLQDEAPLNGGAAQKVKNVIAIETKPSRPTWLANLFVVAPQY